MAVVNPEIDYVAADAETDMPTPSDMAREQMSSMGLNAPSILSSRNETRTEEEIAADRQTLAEVAPGTGDILAVKNYPEDMSTAKEIISQGLDKGELSSVLGGVALAGLATVGLLPSVTGVGAGAKVAKKAVKENLKKNLVKEFGDDGASKVVDTVGEASQPVKVIGVKPPKKTVKAYKLFKKDKNGNLYPLFVKMQGNKPLELNTWTKAEAGEINTKTGKVKSSLGDLAYRPGFHGGDLPIATHIGGKKGKASKPNYRKDNQVWAEVEFGDDTDWQSIANSRALVNKDGTTRVSTAHITDQIPEGGFYRYKTNPNMTGNWLIGGELKINRILTNDEVKSINDAAGVADLPRLSELNMAEGGAVPMKEQMSMFEDGGLLDEGGSIDPVSGNDVPPGSTQEEVRDDIPAQLSEGEFVFPADVVRYFGLETLMKMRQEAKAGLQRMEAMGQMGNSDEATMPDDVPFDVNDLDIEDDGVVEFADGGLAGQNNNTGVYFNPALPQQDTGYIKAAPVQAASSTYQAPQQYVTPTMAQQPTPSFEGFVQPEEGMKPELRTYINSATGEKIQITFINGQPTTPIPDGYVPASEYVKPESVKTEDVRAGGTSSFQMPDEGDGYQEPDNNPYGGFKNTFASDAYSKMTAQLGGLQLGSLSALGKLGTELAGTASAKELSTAMYQAKIAAIADLGIGTVKGNVVTYSEEDVNVDDLNLVADAMKKARDITMRTSGAIDAKKAAEEALERAKKAREQRDKVNREKAKAFADAQTKAARDARAARYAQESGGGDDGGSFTDDPVGTQDSSARADSYSGGSTYGDPDGRAKGGLIAKQMKRSGLASK